MTNAYACAYGVIRCARNVRRRRGARARRVRWGLLVLAAAVMCWMLSGCGVRKAEGGIRNAEFGMMAQGLALQWCAGALLLVESVVAIVLAVRKTAANDRALDNFGEVVEPLGGVECGTRSAECGMILDAAELGRIVGACETEARRVRDLIASAQTTLSVEDYGDALRVAHDAQSMIIGCLGGLQERLGEAANAEVCPPVMREVAP